MTPDAAILHLTDAEIRLLAILPRGTQDAYLQHVAEREDAPR